MSDSIAQEKYDLVVLGAGIQGLSIALELVKRGYKVAIVAKELPEDIHSTAFASPWAGANWHSFATNAAERMRDEITFHGLAKLAQELPDLVERIKYEEYFKERKEGDEPWYRDLMFGWRNLTPSEIPAPYNNGVTYEAYVFNAPLYLAHLASVLRSHSVPIVRHRVSSLDEAFSLSLPSIGPVDLVVNATALGARSLIGVEDTAVYPAKGQTITVRAPDVKISYGHREPHEREGQKTYIIPRPGPDGHVILGGCYLPNDWSTNADPEVAQLILKDCHALCPQLDGKNGKGIWKDIEIVSHNVGLRPIRDGGMRLELEERTLGSQPVDNSLASLTLEKSTLPGGNESRSYDLVPLKGRQQGKKVTVVHAYGIGAAGYQSSLGVAQEVADLVDGWSRRHETNKA